MRALTLAVLAAVIVILAAVAAPAPAQARDPRPAGKCWVRVACWADSRGGYCVKQVPCGR